MAFINNNNNNNDDNVVPPPPPEPQPQYPPLIINQLPPPDPSTQTLRDYINLLIRENDQLLEHDQRNQRLLPLLDIYHEREAVERCIVAFPTVTVTNYSEYSVLFKAVDIPNDIKVWVHESTSPTSVDAIKRHREEVGCRRRILFASELTAEQLTGDINHLFDELNPQYRSDSSDLIEADDEEGFDYSDPEDEALGAEAEAIEKNQNK